jgi:hypothetical protein
MNSISIIGTHHPIQLEGNVEKSGQDEFVALIEQVVHLLGIELIAEEMSEEGLDGTNCSTASKVALELGIEHLFCDPTTEERRALGIADVGRIKAFAAMGLRRAESASEQIKAAYSRREREWLRRIEEAKTWPVLFVCGADHVEPFRRLCSESGLKVQVLEGEWIPASVDISGLI